jgi:hypothetical protein
VVPSPIFSATVNVVIAASVSALALIEHVRARPLGVKLPPVSLRLISPVLLLAVVALVDVSAILSMMTPLNRWQRNVNVGGSLASGETIGNR